MRLLKLDTQLALRAAAVAQLRALSEEVPANLPPIMRWRKLVRKVEPLPGSKTSTRAFRAVATVLADYANKHGRSCFPSVERIAEDSGYSERAVQYALAALEQRGLIRRDVSGGRANGGGGRTTRYVLNVPSAVDEAGDTSVDESPKGASSDAVRVQPSAPEVRHKRSARKFTRAPGPPCG